jgi:type I restriction enzyme M protein
MATTHDIVGKLWNLCHVLRDDGITYHQYVTELTYLLFLKMAEETKTEGRLPEGFRWRQLVAADGVEQLAFYRRLLLELGSHADARVQAIYANASTSIRQPRNLKTLVESIDSLDWYSARKEGLGDLYEGLLEKNAGEQKSGAGQYFTPRPLIECIVDLVKPRAGEVVQDPAAGTGGFLIIADRFIKRATDELFTLPERQQEFQRKDAFYGMELVQDAHRLLLMNALLHGIEGHLSLGDTLSPLGTQLPPADVILTNPPFGTKRGGGKPTRDDFTFPTSNKQLAFLQHVYRGLKPGGRAAVVVPDNVLFEEGVGAQIRADLMDKCDLHTVLRLPTGIFYAQGVKTNVLFFTRGPAGKPKGNTQGIWFYDLRTNVPQFGKRTPLTRAHFADFEAEFGVDPLGTSSRIDQGVTGRFRWVARDDISARGDNLDVTWLRDENAGNDDDLPEPGAIASEIMAKLQLVVEEMNELGSILRPIGPFEVVR